MLLNLWCLIWICVHACRTLAQLPPVEAKLFPPYIRCHLKRARALANAVDATSKVIHMQSLSFMTRAFVSRFYIPRSLNSSTRTHLPLTSLHHASVVHTLSVHIYDFSSAAGAKAEAWCLLIHAGASLSYISLSPSVLPLSLNPLRHFKRADLNTHTTFTLLNHARLMLCPWSFTLAPSSLTPAPPC
jgi:hypothetical protein